MKRIVFLIMIFSVIFCACAEERNENAVSDSGSGAAAGGTPTGTAVPSSVATESAISSNPVTEPAISNSTPTESTVSSEKTDGKDKSDPGMKVTMAKKGKPMLSKRIDPDRKGTELFDQPGYYRFATGPVKGDDGNCYYYRRERKKRGKVTFYRNNGIKVCETVLPEKYEKDYYISAFSKQGERFWVWLSEYESSTEVLVPVQIKDGKWGKGLKEYTTDRLIYYKGYFYASSLHNDGMITIIDQKGNAKRVEIEKEEKRTTLQTVIDDKLYYITQKRESDICTVMRCDLDGSHKEKLFWYNEDGSSGDNYCKLTLDGDFLYLFDPGCRFMLTRVPLYGGEAEEIVETDWYQLTGDSIYYWDKKGISRVDKALKGKSEPVVRLNRKRTGENFFCADGHILVEVHDKEEWEKLETIWLGGTDHDYFDTKMNYSSEYYWISEKGEVDDKIPGSSFFKRYQEWYELAAKYLEEYGPDEDY